MIVDACSNLKLVDTVLFVFKRLKSWKTDPCIHFTVQNIKKIKKMCWQTIFSSTRENQEDVLANYILQHKKKFLKRYLLCTTIYIRTMTVFQPIIVWYFMCHQIMDARKSKPPGTIYFWVNAKKEEDNFLF